MNRLCKPRYVQAACFLAAVLALIASGQSSAAQDVPGPFTRGVIIRFEGPIGSMLEQYTYRKLAAAKELGADLVILEIDSPGGELEASLNLAEEFRRLAWAHTVAYVPREALSGAAIVALGCDEILMGDNATLGDAGPIFLDENFLFQHVPEKVRSNLARRMRDLAESHGRPPALAEAMIDTELIVHRVKDTESDEIAFMSDAEIETSDDPDRWEKIKPVMESREGKFLEVNGRRAVELGLAESVVLNRGNLKPRYQLPEEPLVLKRTGVDVAVHILNQSFVTGLLLVIGLAALLIEFSAPGLGVGGLVSLLCFSLFFWSRFLGGTAIWLEVVLFAVALMFLATELFIFPGFGVAGLSGVLLLLVSLVLASQDFVVPERTSQWMTLGHSLLVLFSSGVAVIGVGVGMTYYLGEVPILGRIALKPPDPDAPIASDVAASRSGAAAEPVHYSGVKLGDQGVTDSPLTPAGKVRFGDHWVDVVSEGVYLEKGQSVRVVKIQGNRLVVRRVEDVG